MTGADIVVPEVLYRASESAKSKPNLSLVVESEELGEFEAFPLPGKRLDLR
ncbi:hypothetical protein VSU01S_01830 [Vibrio superstes NBRC 103154]|uniref:Uncharacterized protein n=1 Tax=Vibrio superstes NBRC 103154 TaxID=1219062 RepID=A0A511QKT5_9VIBR|nr:hypothetical protein VSU01S_01830 [Vibrio superstes NBRC 103154]